MRSDPYRERARALAVEASLDPDAKIDRPGQRPMPVWCTFRDAARKEQLATEAAAVATALPPQAPQFQNAPLKVFGDHDEGTLAQMRNRMGVGNVVAGVICADGHLGYAQPVGASSPMRNRSASRASASTSAAATWRCGSIRRLQPSRTTSGPSSKTCRAPSRS
jgi:hypothetical protein